jgi:hypothetical protein
MKSERVILLCAGDCLDTNFRFQHLALRELRPRAIAKV